MNWVQEPLGCHIDVVHRIPPLVSETVSSNKRFRLPFMSSVWVAGWLLAAGWCTMMLPLPSVRMMRNRQTMRNRPDQSVEAQQQQQQQQRRATRRLTLRLNLVVSRQPSLRQR